MAVDGINGVHWFGIILVGIFLMLFISICVYACIKKYSEVWWEKIKPCLTVGCQKIKACPKLVYQKIKESFEDDLNSFWDGKESESTEFKNAVDHYLSRKPEIVTICEVSERTSSWSPMKTNKEVIWRENKTFEFQHWIDLTDTNLVQKYSKGQFVRIDFEIDFDDLETEQAYEEHVQTLLNELPEFCQNGDIVLKRIERLEGDDVTKGHWFQLMNESPFHHLIFSIIGIALHEGIWWAGRIGRSFCPKRIVVKKVVTTKNLEVAI